MLTEARQQRAEDRLATLVAINRGFAGGDSARQLSRRLAREAGLKP